MSPRFGVPQGQGWEAVSWGLQHLLEWAGWVVVVTEREEESEQVKKTCLTWLLGSYYLVPSLESRQVSRSLGVKSRKPPNSPAWGRCGNSLAGMILEARSGPGFET